MLPFVRMLEYGNIIPNKIEVKKVASGIRHFFVLGSNGVLYGSGENPYKQLGIDYNSTDYFGTYIELDTNVENIWAAGNFSIKKKKDGSFWYAGLGGITNTQTVWTQLSTEFGSLNPADIDDVFCAFNIVHFKDKSGNIYAIGMNSNLNSGTSATGQITQCTLVPGITGVKYMTYTNAAGTVLALTETNQMYGWGRNANGELGRGNNTAITNPILIEAGVDMVFSGYSATGYIAGTWVRTAGNQIYGQLGNNNNSQSHVNQMTYAAVTFGYSLTGVKIPIYSNSNNFNMGFITESGIYSTGMSTTMYGSGRQFGTSYPLFVQSPSIPFTITDVQGCSTIMNTSTVYTKDKLYQAGNTVYMIGYNGGTGQISNFVEVPLPWSN